MVRALGWMLVGMVLTLALVWAGFTGLERQIEIDRQLKSDRCASFGENMTKEQAAYCEDLGV